MFYSLREDLECRMCGRKTDVAEVMSVGLVCRNCTRQAFDEFEAYLRLAADPAYDLPQAFGVTELEIFAIHVGVAYTRAFSEARDVNSLAATFKGRLMPHIETFVSTMDGGGDISGYRIFKPIPRLEFLVALGSVMAEAEPGGVLRQILARWVPEPENAGENEKQESDSA